MYSKEMAKVFGTEFDKIVLSVEPNTQVFQAELSLNGEKVGEVKPTVAAGVCGFGGWEIWNLLKTMLDDGRELCVVFLLDEANRRAILNVYQQLCKMLDADDVRLFGRVLTPERLEINCKSRKKFED